MRDDRLRRIYSDQQSVFNGSVRGRLTSTPVVNRTRGLTDAESMAPEQDDERTQFMQETMSVATVSSVQTIQLTYVPLTHSEHVYWKPAGAAGIYLEEGPDWLTTDIGEISISGANIQVGDEIIVEYAYRVPVDFQSSNPVLVNTSVVGATSSAPATAIGMPAGTKGGDLLTLGLISGFGVAAYCNDPRMTVVENNPIYSRGSGFWVGYASDLSTPISIFTQGNVNATGQFAVAVLTSWRGNSGPLRYNLNKVYRGPSDSSTTTVIPGLGGNMSGAIMCFRTYAGIGGVYAYQDWTKAPAYTTVTGGDHNYVEVDYGLSLYNPVPPQTTPNTNTGAGWVATVIALR